MYTGWTTLFQDCNAEERPDNQKCPYTCDRKPVGAQNFLGIVAVCNAELPHEVGCGIHGTGQAGSSQDGDCKHAHWKTGGNGRCGEHLRDDLDLRNSGRFDTKSADHGCNQHNSAGVVSSKSTEQIGQRGEAAAKRDEIEQVVNGYKYDEHSGLRRNTLDHGIHCVINLHAGENGDNSSKDAHNGQRVIGALLGIDTVADQYNKGNEKCDCRALFLRADDDRIEILDVIAQLIIFLACCALLRAVCRDPHTDQPDSREWKNCADHQLTIAQTGNFLSDESDASQGTNHKTDLPGHLEQRRYDAGSNAQGRHNGNKDRGDDCIAAAKRAEKATDDDRANDKRDFGFGLRPRHRTTPWGTAGTEMDGYRP